MFRDDAEYGLGCDPCGNERRHDVSSLQYLLGAREIISTCVKRKGLSKTIRPHFVIRKQNEFKPPTFFAGNCICHPSDGIGSSYCVPCLDLNHNIILWGGCNNIRLQALQELRQLLRRRIDSDVVTACAVIFSDFSDLLIVQYLRVHSSSIKGLGASDMITCNSSSNNVNPSSNTSEIS